MRVFRDAWRRGDLPSGTVATVGNFDGLHRGQRAIVGKVVERATAQGLISVVVTFEPHPLSVLRPEAAPPRLTTLEQKCALLGEAGVDAVVVVSFDQEFAATGAWEFVESLLFDRLDVRELFIGSRFVFGHDREGDLSLLEEMTAGSGRRVSGVEEIVDHGEPVSSTRIRSAIQRGDVEEALRLLGRPYCLAGTVVHGDAMGCRLGWPTMNLELVNELLPSFGVYRSRARIEGGEAAPAITNIGLRPTIHSDSRPTVETHLLDFDGDLYDRRAEVELLDRLRGERRFTSIGELKEQIARDVVEARRRFDRDSR
jgi:riboflavin kinase/FMN adenylyltransferase